jgi:YcaO-like protein with predicted kinase domain
MEGQDLAGGRRWLPYELVHTNFSLPLPTGSGAFVMSSNGLASGNHPLEAISHAICEVVERDANALWSARGGTARHETRVNAGTIDDADALALLDRIEGAGLAVGLWNTTSDVGLASFRCVVVDRVPNHMRQLYFAFGSGCHPVRTIALIRAITEAVQCRLTYIAGARDDADRDFFERARNPDRVARLREQVEAGASTGADFQSIPSFDGEDFAADVAHERACLASVGLGDVTFVDLTRPEFGVPVVRVVVPGLESLHDAPGYVPGRRARAAATQVPR